MDEKQQRIEALRATRPDYDAEVAWHRFLLDAVCGTGGFRGKIGPTAISYLGWAAEAYARDFASSQLPAQSADTRLSYLDQFPREDDAKFSRRIDIAHYVNYTGPLGEIFLAYVNKEEMNRDEVSQRLNDWSEDVDGKGNSWDVLQRTVVRPRAALLGWCPVMWDKPVAPRREISVAHAEQLGLKLRTITLFPFNILDWTQEENGELSAVKIRTTHCSRPDLLKPGVREEHYAVWYPDRVLRQVIYIAEDGKETLGAEKVIEHTLGIIPLEMFRASKPLEDTELRGASIIGDIATINKRIFNLDSELDEHTRGQVFATLGIPVEDPSLPLGEAILGPNNALKINMESKLPLHYVAPPASVAEVIEKRREVLVREIYRIARLEYAKPTGVTTSGIARAYEFEQTNRRLADIAGAFADSEQRALRKVEKLLGESDSKVTVTAPADFSVEDMATEIENVMSANEVDLGVTAGVEMKRRLARRMLPNLPAETQAEIEQELDEMKVQAEQDKALEREVAEAAAKAGVTAQPGAVAPGSPPGQGQGQAPGGVPGEA